jgi:uncharacterized protein (TIGR00369 family)
MSAQPAPDLDATPADGIALMRQFIAHSPFARLVGLELAEIEPDHAAVRLPFRDEVATYVPVVHGGAIATAADVAAMAAAFSGAQIEGTPSGATVGFSISYMRAVRGEGVTAHAHVARRGRSLNFIDVKVVADSGEVAAQGHVIYKIN